MAGIAVIFLSHVRSAMLVVVIGCGVVYAIVMIIQVRVRAVLSTVVLMVVGGVGSLLYAESMEGKARSIDSPRCCRQSVDGLRRNPPRMGMVVGAFDTFLV